MDVFVKDTIQKAMDGTFQGENYLGTLENDGVGIGISSAWADKIPAEMLAELDQLKNDIISGKLSSAPTKITAPEGFKGCQVTDTGGIDDKSFNATAWKGFQDAQALYGGEIKYLEIAGANRLREEPECLHPRRLQSHRSGWFPVGRRHQGCGRSQSYAAFRHR